MKLHNLLDTPALIIAMAVDIALVGISLFIIAPGPVEKAGMVLLSLVIVLFSVRAWIKGGTIGRVLWLCFALSAFFIDLSFALVSTDVQAQVAVDNELTRLTGKVDEAERQVTALQAQYDNATNRTTIDQLNEQIKAADAKAGKYRSDRSERLRLNESGSGKEITSSALSTAIYDAATSGKPGRVTFLVLFALIFFGLQLTLIAAATESFRVKKEPAKIEPVLPVQPTRLVAKNTDLERWIAITWTYIRNGRGFAPVTKESFLKVTSKSSQPFSPELWEQYMEKAKKVGVIVDGKIIEKNQKIVLDRMM